MTSSVGWTSRAGLAEHFSKHGREVGAVSEAAYLRMAQSLRDAKVGGDVLQAIRPDRVISRYDRRSGGFVAFNQDKTIRTYFHPNDGERYFRRQAGRR